MIEQLVSKGRFGAFGGVFTPSVLTILGVVMYMRFGWVVGQQGLGGALLIVGVAHLISVATGLSVASIATNRTVGAGGAYYMISRSLGAPAGAAIGLPLFLGQALGVTFYVVGFTESLAILLPWLSTPIIPGITYEKLLGTLVCLALTVLSIKSSDLAIKVQYVVMMLIAVSLVSVFLGSGETPPEHIVWTNPDGESFVKVFAVFFPAVTGIMAGVSMSGDLKDPRHAIPRGTLGAIFVCLVIYIALPCWLAANATTDALVADTNILWKIAAVPALIYVGVWAATLSSALASVMTAPRTLQALALDGHAPNIFGRTYGKGNEPVPGLLLTFALAETGVLAGDLDMVAPILTMFFLVTYGITNLACGLEKWAASPSFRPEFRVPSGVSLFGALACFYVMSIINMLAMFAALFMCGGIYVLTQRRMLGNTYGDARHGIWAALVRSALHRLKQTRFHPLNWRPNLLIMGGNPDKRYHMIELGSAIVQDRGIVSYAHLIKGAIEDNIQVRKDLHASVGPRIGEQFPNLFYRVDIVDDIYRGVVMTAQAYGVGNLECNSVMLGWPHKKDRREDFVHMLQDLVRLDRSILLVNYKPVASLPGKRRTPEIHVWWGGLESNGGLMLLLAFLLTAEPPLRNATVRVMTAVDDEESQAEATKALGRIISAARLQRAEASVILKEGRSIQAIMGDVSHGADLAILGFAIPDIRGSQDADGFFERMDRMLAVLPTTILVHSARNFESEPVLFDQ